MRELSLFPLNEIGFWFCFIKRTVLQFLTRTTVEAKQSKDKHHSWVFVLIFFRQVTGVIDNGFQNHAIATKPE